MKNARLMVGARNYLDSPEISLAPAFVPSVNNTMNPLTVSVSDFAVIVLTSLLALVDEPLTALASKMI